MKITEDVRKYAAEQAISEEEALKQGMEEPERSGDSRRQIDNPEDCPRGRSEAQSKVEGFEPPGGEREGFCAAKIRRPRLREQLSQFVEKGAEVYPKA